MPIVVWKKDGNLTLLPAVSSIVSAINSSERLEIGGNGATYQEAGNYTCEVNNGVDGMPVLSSTLEIICECHTNFYGLQYKLALFSGRGREKGEPTKG